MTIHISHKIMAKTIHFSNKLEINNKHPNIPTIYHPMITIIINQIFLHHIHENIAHKNIKVYPQNPADIQSYQPSHMQNPTNTQPYQRAQSQNPVSRHSYQPKQMQNEIPLPYYLQQHEIAKQQPTNFSQIPNAKLSITLNKPLMVF